MTRFIKNLFGNKKQKNNIVVASVKNNSTFIPKDWYVVEAGQNPLHMLWFATLVNFDDVANNIKKPRYVVVEECDSFEIAIQKCIEKIKNIPVVKKRFCAKPMGEVCFGNETDAKCESCGHWV